MKIKKVETWHQVVSIDRDAEFLLTVVWVASFAERLPPIVSRTRGARGAIVCPDP